MHNSLSAPKEAFLAGNGNEALPDFSSIAAASGPTACRKILAYSLEIPLCIGIAVMLSLK